MEKHYFVVLCLCIFMFAVTALDNSNNNNNNNNNNKNNNDNDNNKKNSQPDKVILLCPVLQEVVDKDGGFEIVYWSICTSNICDNKHSTWDWMAGMNRHGKTELSREGINIRRDGALEIQRVRLNDTGTYMCTVRRTNHRSPRVHFATLAVSRVELDKKATCKPDPQDCRKDYSKDNEHPVFIAMTCLLSVLLVLAVGFIVYLKRNEFCRVNQGNGTI